MFPLILLVIVLIIFLISLNENKKDSEEITKNDNKKIYYKTDYLGGHPIETEGIKNGVLKIVKSKKSNNKKIEFSNNYSQNLFEFEIKDITSCKLETKKSISSKRIALVGILAFGLKKGHSYIRISFNHKLGKQDVIFYNHNKKNKDIVKNINSARMFLLEKDNSKAPKNNISNNEDFDVSSIANEAKKRINENIDNL